MRWPFTEIQTFLEARLQPPPLSSRRDSTVVSAIPTRNLSLHTMHTRSPPPLLECLVDNHVLRKWEHRSSTFIVVAKAQ